MNELFGQCVCPLKTIEEPDELTARFEGPAATAMSVASGVESVESDAYTL